MQNTISGFPLQWPEGFSRTDAGNRIKSKFKSTSAQARDQLTYEVLNKLRATDLVISTNVPLKQNGELRADQARFRLTDPGVAIYFKRKGKDIVMCCDQYKDVWENLVALAKAIDAIRGLERWGVSDFIDRAFTGFEALPAAGETSEDAFKVLGIPFTREKADIVEAYRLKAMTAHPDRGGSAAEFDRLYKAYQTALQTTGHDR